MKYVTQIQNAGMWLDLTHHNSYITAQVNAKYLSEVDGHEVVRIVERKDEVVQTFNLQVKE